tara:strand:- start:102 stop:911 length:810 start_codon:yes stop_codon:yes gene_type:complete
MKNYIVVPVDFSPISKIALQQTQNLAQLTDSEIVLLNVTPVGKEEEAYKKLDEFVASANLKTGVKIIKRVEAGRVVPAILKVNEELDPILVVVGFNSKEGFFDRMGSNTFALISKARRSVITIKGEQHRDGCKTIVLPLDLTKETRQKVRHAIWVAKLFGAEIKIAIVHEDKTKMDQKSLKFAAFHAVDRIKKEGVPCSEYHIDGKNIAAEVLKFSEEQQADLIVIMTQQENSISDFFVGSVAQNIVNKSNIPVLSITPKESTVSSWKS